MLEVELDIFSGMPNPRWVLSRQEEDELVSRLTAEPTQVSPVSTPDEEFGLGYRGLIVRLIKPEDDSPWSRAQSDPDRQLPHEFRVGPRAATDAPVAEWLVQTSEPSHKRSRVTDELRSVVAEGIILQSGGAALDPSSLGAMSADADPESDYLPTLTGEGADAPGLAAGDAGIEGSTWWACGSNYFSPNADLFNRPEYVTRNNCYCFASNHVANSRYARPGRRAGQPATSITCGGVTAGLYADGWRDGCQPNGLTIVLVIWPGVDYHFYRLVTGSPYWWWGHKPGGTPAKYTDDCGNSIYQYNGRGYAPNNCCRGSYTDFCGYFYQNNSTAFVA